MGEPRCETCRWWGKTVYNPQSYGPCKKRAPIAVPLFAPAAANPSAITAVEPGWPLTHSTDFCGEHAPAQEAPARD